MSKRDERSEGGSPIYRHTEIAPSDGGVAHADDERLVKHMEACFGVQGMVFHEIVSDRVHIDVHMVPPTDDRPCYVLMTSGMSGLPMTVPDEMEDRASWTHAELCLLLPPGWKLDQGAFSDERNYWPIRLLKQLARLPHEFGTWLGYGHSIPNGDPPEPYCKGIALTGAIVIPPFVFGSEFFEVPGEPPIHVYQVLPVTTREMDYKLEHGADDLFERLETKFPEVYGPIDPSRSSAI
jgi:hypothetical protein